MNYIKQQLREDLEYFSVSDASPESDEFEIGLEEDADTIEYIKAQLKEFNNQFL
jgi:hypothetical protein